MTRIGVDVGGTFTDVVAVDGDGRLYGAKTPSTPERPDDGVVEGLRRAREDGVDVDGAAFLGHGTTVATNAVLEGDLATTALVTTEGFRDVLEIGRQDRPALYDLDFERPAPVVPRERRFEVGERVGPDGEVLAPLGEDDVAAVAEAIPEAVEAVAVATLFSFRDDEHERAIREGLRAAGVDAAVSLSSEVLPEIREYERASTTALNAALKPVVQTYLDRLAARTDGTGHGDHGTGAPWLVMQSHGGLAGVDAAGESPVNTVLSGPAAGVRGAQYLAAAAGHESVVTMDAGGTSTDVSLIEGGDPSLTTDWSVGGHPLRVPAIDVHTVGAGGGSLARIDEGGALRVGPESAGADPGPAAYGRGGTRPTVTDAHVVLGRVHPDYPLGGELSVDPDAAAAAVEEHVADPLGQSVEAAARGVLEVARANTERALRVVSVERGHDPREFALVAFGGAGPLTAPRLAEALSVPTVLVPRLAGVLSGLGLLVSDREHTYVRSVVEPVADVDPATVESAFDDLLGEGRETLREEGVDADAIGFRRALDLRYVGQTHTLTVDVEADGDTGGETAGGAAGWRAAVERFHEAHEGRYGHANPSEPVELVSVRVTAVGDIEPMDLRASVDGTVADATTGTRAVAVEDGHREATVYDHARLPPGAEFDGPAVVHADAATTVVHPGQSVRVDERGTLCITTRAGQEADG